MLVRVLRDVETTFPNASFVITSFDHPLIGELQRTIDSHKLSWECGYLVCRVPTAAEITTYSCEWVGFNTRALTRPVVVGVQSAGKKVFAYTPNDMAEFDRCVAMGVDGMYTDDVKLWISRYHFCGEHRVCV